MAFLAAVAPVSPVAAQGASFISEGALTSDTGQVLVEWQADGPVTLGIADAGEPDAVREVYQGDNRSYFLSGLADGDYVLVLGNAQMAEAATIDLTVTQQSLALALLLTVIGAIITLGIVVTIFRGSRP